MLCMRYCYKHVPEGTSFLLPPNILDSFSVSELLQIPHPFLPSHWLATSQHNTLNLAFLKFSLFILNISSTYQKVLNSSIMLKNICSPSQLTLICKSHTSSFWCTVQDTSNNVDHMWAQDSQLHNHPFVCPPSLTSHLF